MTSGSVPRKGLLSTEVVRRHAWILAIVGLLLFFWRLGSHDLWPSDEPRFGLQAWEMRQNGEY